MKGATLDRKVHLRTLVRADLERVYDAFATADDLERWFTKGPAGNPTIRVLELLRPERFVCEIQSGSDTTTVEITFEEVDEGTLVNFVEYGYGDAFLRTQHFLNHVSGWARILTTTKLDVEREPGGLPS